MVSQENVEVVRRAWEAFSRRENQSALELYDPEIEIQVEFFDGGRVYRGPEGVQAYFRNLLGVLDYDSEILELLDAGDQVVAVMRIWGRGKTSAAPFERHESHVWTLRERKLWRLRSFPDRVEALRAAGLEE
jgi:ketosteroid isomerase-like protein